MYVFVVGTKSKISKSRNVEWPFCDRFNLPENPCIAPTVLI